jgi:putative ABC transport system permease protein
MKISLLGIVLGLVLVAFPIFVIVQYRLTLLNRYVKSIVRLLVSMAVVALCTFASVKLNSLALNILLALLFCVFSTAMSVMKSRLKFERSFLPSLTGVVAGTIVVGLYFIFLVMGSRGVQVSAALVPIYGLLAGGMIEANSRALETYYSGLRNHNQLYYYLLGNGCTHAKATEYFFRRGLQASIIVACKRMSAVVFIAAPSIFFVAVMGGMDVLTAAALQVFLLFAVLSASLISVFVSLLIGRRYNFDEYNKLKKVFKSEGGRPQGPHPATLSESSLSNPSAPHDTDSASQPQE